MKRDGKVKTVKPTRRHFERRADSKPALSGGRRPRFWEDHSVTPVPARRRGGRREVSLDQPTRGSGRSVRPVGTRRFSHAWRRITAFDHELFGMIKRHSACAINIVSVNALKADNYRFKDLSLANRPR